MTDPADGYVRAYIVRRWPAHFVAADGTALCGAAPGDLLMWRTPEGRPDCTRCVNRARFLAEIAVYDGPPPRPGVVAVLERGKVRVPAGECAACGELRPIPARGLCEPCRKTAERDGTLSEYGWVRSDRLTEFASLRDGGLPPHQAAARLGVSRRTAWRYERALDSAGQAPWRARLRMTFREAS